MNRIDINSKSAKCRADSCDWSKIQKGWRWTEALAHATEVHDAQWVTYERSSANKARITAIAFRT